MAFIVCGVAGFVTANDLEFATTSAPPQGSSPTVDVRTVRTVSYFERAMEAEAEVGAAYSPSVCGATPSCCSAVCGSDPCGSGCCAADDCCLPPCCRMCPCQYAWVDGLILWRDNQGRNQPLVQDLTQTTTFLSTRDIDFGSAGGVRAGFGWRGRGPCGWELNYLGLYSPTAATFITGDDLFSLPGDLGLASNNFFSADEFSIRYTAQINSAEVNRVCCWCCCNDPYSDAALRCKSVEWLYGFRYLNLNENFSITATDFEEGTSTYRVRTNNNLFGAQIGSRLRYCFGRWSVEGTGKAGIFGNAAEQNSPAIIDFPAFELRPARSASRGEVAFVGDLNLTGIYQLNSTWGVRAGYNLLFIEGVALAPDQLDFTNTPTSGTALDTRGGVFLHGVNVGLEARW